MGWWPALGSTASIAIYTAFIFTEVAVFIVSAVMLDSMMADVVKEQRKTNQQTLRGFVSVCLLASSSVHRALSVPA